MTLDAFDRWCVRSNLARIASGETTAEAAVALIHANGYPDIAAAVAHHAGVTPPPTDIDTDERR